MSDHNLAELEEFFLALSDGTRLRLLSLMRDGEVSVGYLSDELDQSQPKISRHLAYLRSASLVETRRDGKWIYYHIAEPVDRFASDSLADALDWVGDLTGKKPVRKRVTENLSYDEAEAAALDEDVGCESYSNDIEVYLL